MIINDKNHDNNNNINDRNYEIYNKESNNNNYFEITDTIAKDSLRVKKSTNNKNAIYQLQGEVQ